MAEIEKDIIKYIQGTSTEAANIRLAKWLLESPENRQKLYAEKDIWDTLGYNSDYQGYNIEDELKKLKSGQSKAKVPVFNLFKRIIRIAAIILITFGLGWSTRFINFEGSRSTKDIAIQEIVVPKGQINQLFLADGTRIWVNSESKIKIPSVFTDKERVVQLSGEAYFEVAKDAKHPFRVEVKGQTINVLGTSFNVRAYPNRNQVQTTLSTGQILLITGNNRSVLNPGDQCNYNESTNQLTVNKVNPVSYSSWKEGRYEFQNEDLVEVFKVVERWYDVEIHYKESDFRGMRFSGVIKRNKDVQHFLNLLNYSIPIKYHIDLDYVVISPK